MTGWTAVLRREIGGWLGQPLGSIALALFVAVLSAATLGVGDALGSPVADLRGVFAAISAGFLVLVPAVTMRTFAEERRSGSLELLLTLPLGTMGIVFAKWLASVAVVGVALLLTLPWPIAFAIYGDLDRGPVIGGYLGMGLLGAAYAAIGVLASALADAQILAFLLAFVAGLAPWGLGFALARLPGPVVPWVEPLTFGYHFANLAKGAFDTRSVAYLLGMTAIALLLTAHALESRRLS